MQVAEGVYHMVKMIKHISGKKDLRARDPCCGEGNGNPLQYSYLENPMDGGAW